MRRSKVSKATSTANETSATRHPCVPLEPVRAEQTHAQDWQTLFAAEDVCWHLSQISVLEIQIKYDLGKLELPDTPQKFLPNLIRDSGLNFHTLENKAILMLGKLPQLHRDPFDRLLIASALVKGWEIATVDTIFDQYPVQIVN